MHHSAAIKVDGFSCEHEVGEPDKTSDLSRRLIAIPCIWGEREGELRVAKHDGYNPDTL